MTLSVGNSGFKSVVRNTQFCGYMQHIKKPGLAPADSFDHLHDSMDSHIPHFLEDAPFSNAAFHYLRFLMCKTTW